MLIAGSALLLALVHIFGARLRFIRYIPRSRWLSFAGGVSVSYIFVHLLPELAAGAESLAAREPFGWESEHLAWVVALIGMASFYGVEVAARRSHSSGDRTDRRSAVFWFSIVSYALYNALIAYLLHHRLEEGHPTLFLFVAAMALHFLINDFALREHHKDAYSTFGRWLLVAAILIGAATGAMTRVSEAVLATVVAFIAGGVILNVLKEELPSEAESSFLAFASGAGLYTAILLFV